MSGDLSATYATTRATGRVTAQDCLAAALNIASAAIRRNPGGDTPDGYQPTPEQVEACKTALGALGLDITEETA